MYIKDDLDISFFLMYMDVIISVKIATIRVDIIMSDCYLHFSSSCMDGMCGDVKIGCSGVVCGINASPL